MGSLWISRLTSTLVLGLCFAPVLILAHGSDEHGSNNVHIEAIAHGQEHPGNAQDSAHTPGSEPPPSYFSHAEHVGLLYAHIAFMTVAWLIVLPVAVALSIVKSKYTLATQLSFLAVNGGGLFFSVLYNAQTPDLYPGNAHHPMGWILSSIATVQFCVSLLGRLADRLAGRSLAWRAEHEHLFLHSHEAQALHSPGFRQSSDGDRPYGTESHSPRSDSILTMIGEEEEGHYSSSTHKASLDGDFFEPAPMTDPYATRSATGISRIAQLLVRSRLWKGVRIGYSIADWLILPLGSAAFATGIITMGRFFSGSGLLNGLAHWIKGGVFFWLGIATLGRWAGSFASLGWAWNIRPDKKDQKWRPSAELVESSLILFYGVTNIFLEHLSGWGGAWSKQDFEHISITVLFIGGGLCGILVESAGVRELLNTSLSVEAQTAHGSAPQKGMAVEPPPSYKVSINPIPALMIMLLGIMMSSHHQASMTSTMVHKQWGNLLSGAALARALTYAVMYIRPPTSVFPSRPPTELLTSFGLMAGGLVFMASSKDTIDGMIRQDLDAMFLYTVILGMVGLVMAWVIAVLAIKGFALRREIYTSAQRHS